MPKINGKVNTRTQQQQIRRMKAREVEFEKQLIENNISCINLNSLYKASKEELELLIPMIKKIIQHNEKKNQLITEGAYREPIIYKDEYNEELYEYLNEQYKGIKAKRLKYQYENKKDRFREIIIKENQLQFNNNLKDTAENTIKKFFDNIDISNYQPTERDYKKEKEEQEKKYQTIEPKEVEVIIPECPKIEVKVEEPPKEPKKKTKKEKKTKKKKEEPKPEPKPEPKTEDINDESDSDIEEDIKRLEERENKDKDDDIDIKEWTKEFYKLWKDEITQSLSQIEEDEPEFDKSLSIDEQEKEFKKWLENEHQENLTALTNYYFTRSKNLTKGTKSKYGKFSNDNPGTTKKIIQGIIKKQSKEILKEL